MKQNLIRNIVAEYRAEPPHLNTTATIIGITSGILSIIYFGGLLIEKAIRK